MKLGDLIYKDTNIQTLLDVIQKVDDQTRAEVLKAISTRLTQAGKESALRNIKKIVQLADPAIKEWLSQAIPQSYVEGINFTDYEFNSIKMRESVAEDALNNIIRKVDKNIAKKLRNVSTRNVYDWGDLTEKMSKAVSGDQVAMGEIRFQILKEWEKYTPGANISVDSNQIGKEYEKYKLRITPEEIKIARDLSIHADTVNALLSNSYLDFANGMNGLVRGAEQKLNEAMKQQMRAKILAKEIAGQSVEKVKREITKLLGDQGFSVLTDRGGHTWTLRRYSEMLARTHVIKASNEALINRAGQFGVDIVQISTHSGACPLCTPYEGNLYSLSGTSETYPPLNIGLPIHPNCRHVLLMRPDLT